MSEIKDQVTDVLNRVVTNENLPKQPEESEGINQVRKKEFNENDILGDVERDSLGQPTNLVSSAS